MPNTKATGVAFADPQFESVSVTGQIYAGQGVYTPTYTYATLPAASSVAAGTQLWTSDQGMVVSNGSSWIVTNSFAKSKNRTILIGDSLLANGKKNTNVNSTAGGFVVSGGIVTINTSTAGSHNLLVGNYAVVYNPGDTANSLSNVCVKILSAPSTTTATFSATYNGVTLADGDYSTLGGQPWSISSLSTTPASWFPWMNAFLGSPFTVVANYAIGGSQSSVSVSGLSKFLAGPTFDYAVIGFGTNDINTASTAALANAAVTTVYNNFVTMVNAIINYGAKPIIAIPPPFGAAISAGNPTFKNIALLNLRERLLELAKSDSRITCIDLMKTMMLGTSATGDFISGYVIATAGDSIHPTSTASIALAKNEIAAGTWYDMPVKINDREPISILDDYQNNTANSSGAVTPNILQNGLFTGTGAASGGTATGTMPTNWSFAAATGTVTSASQQARTAISSTAGNIWGAGNAANWGYAWTINASGTAAAQGYTLQSSAYTSLLQNGSWYQFGITLKALADFANVRSITPNFFLNGAAGSGVIGSTLVFDQTLTDSSACINLKNGDVIQLTTPPIYIGGTPSTALIQIVVTSNAASWAMNAEWSSAYVRAVPSPYA